MPEHIQSLSLTEKLYYIASMELAQEEQVEFYNMLAGR